MRPTQFKKKECARRRWRERQSAGNKDCGQVAAGGGGVLFIAIRMQLSTIIRRRFIRRPHRRRTAVPAAMGLINL